jgi:lipopolysaccharide/colanic/teichoic acid biosynthesis glycosyltransferase
MDNMLGQKANGRPENQLSIMKEAFSGFGMLPQELFTKLLCLERKRTERSGRRFVLMLLDTGDLLKAGKKPILAKLLSAITQAIRDTDLKGWYKDHSVIGVIFTEIGGGESQSIVRALSSKLTDSLYSALTVREINEIGLSFHVFPEDWDEDSHDGPVTSALRVDLAGEVNRKKFSLTAKRFMDIMGSIVGLILCLPVFVLIWLAVRLTSKGPALFRQVRLGQCGKKFTFLKFRSMYLDNNQKLHEEYVKRFIMGAPGTEQPASGQQKVYKLTSDPRITPVGRFLRNTSLDELPQFLNVLRGDMSLVGPRPPVTYEFERYDLWHKQRLIALKPGITGLWQVDGRSRVKFDEMVRLDIRYGRSWSLWLDIKILLHTPRAVFSRDGAC